ncbi:MAG: LamG-like jellyroll fold domain-containing protein, partial [Planctomycetota bacterium]
VFMGLTAGCAVCHDHKFDPLSMRDFYAMAAFFNNTTQGAMDGNIPNTPPVIPVPARGDETKIAKLQESITSARKALDERRDLARKEFEAWQAKAAPRSTGSVSADGLVLSASLTEGAGAKAKFLVLGKERQVELANPSWVPGRDTGKALRLNGSAAVIPDAGDFDASQAFTLSAWLKPPVNAVSGPVVARMEGPPGHRGWDFWIQEGRAGMHLIHRWPDAGLKVFASSQLQPNAWTHVTVTHDGTGKASGVKVYYNGKEQPVRVENDRLAGAGTTKTPVPLRLGAREAGEPLRNMPIEDLRIYARALAAHEAESLANSLEQILAKPADKRGAAEKDQLFAWYLGDRNKEYQKGKEALASLEKEEISLRGKGTIAHVMQEKPGEAMAFILERGEYDRR